MEPDVRGKQLGQASWAPYEGAGEDVRSEQRAWRGDRALVHSEVARSAALMEAVGRTEKDIADTLRAMAWADGNQAAARRLRLAEAAIRGAHEAAERAEELQRLADWRARHEDVAVLRHSVDHAGKVLADLASTEEGIAAVLIRLAGEGCPHLAEERRRLAGEALAGAQYARRRARALRSLATTSAARAEIPASGRPAEGGAAR